MSPRLLSGQVSVSPQGFPSEKIVFEGVDFGCARCSQDNYLLPARDCTLETHVGLRNSPGWYPRYPVA